MLSEAFFSTILYQQMMDGESQQDHALVKLPSLKCPRNNVRRAEDHHSCRVKFTVGGACVCGEEGQELGYVASSSQAMTIPSRDLSSPHSLDLYTSWSSMYGNIFKNYPDLHIGGDHIMKRDSGCVLECDDGPVLVSVDIDRSSPPTYLVGGAQEERFLQSEDSHVFPSAPSSNSILNGFLELKMQELYKQCYEETLGSNGSPNLRWPNVLMANLHQLSLMVSQDQNMDQAKAKEAILQYLYSATSGGSSEFLTPILHISNQDNRKKSSTWSRKLRP